MNSQAVIGICIPYIGGFAGSIITKKNIPDWYNKVCSFSFYSF